MAMVKTSRPDRTGGKTVQAASSLKIETDSRQAGKGSENGGVYINERGEVCYGNQCVTLAIDQQRREIRVNIKRSGACDVDGLVEALRQSLGEGCRTVYEVESEYKEK